MVFVVSEVRYHMDFPVESQTGAGFARFRATSGGCGLLRPSYIFTQDEEEDIKDIKSEEEKDIKDIKSEEKVIASAYACFGDPSLP